MNNKLYVKDWAIGKRVVTHIGTASSSKQEEITIQADWTDSLIIKAITNGVDISHFGETKDNEGSLDDYVINQKQLYDRLNPTVRTELVAADGIPAQAANGYDAAKTIGLLVIAKVTLKAASQYIAAESAEDLEGLDIAAIAKVLKIEATPEALLSYKK